MKHEDVRTEIKKNNEIKYAFIASSKVIRYKLDPKSADILATLIYKFEYWERNGELFEHNGKLGFHISLDGIREETCFGKDVIQSRIKRLEKEGLIEKRQQGLNKPNFFFIDVAKIKKYIKKHDKEYQEWRLKIRDSKPEKPKNGWNKKNTNSGSSRSTIQAMVKPSTTNNKNTNNKKIKTLTNPINGEEENDFIQYSMLLEELIDDLRTSDNPSGKDKLINDIYIFLNKMIPQFQKFKISEQDIALITQMANNGPSSFTVAGRVIRNAKAIISGGKKMRFGNLFVGIREMYEQYELKCI